VRVTSWRCGREPSGPAAGEEREEWPRSRFLRSLPRAAELEVVPLHAPGDQAGQAPNDSLLGAFCPEFLRHTFTIGIAAYEIRLCVNREERGLPWARVARISTRALNNALFLPQRLQCCCWVVSQAVRQEVQMTARVLSNLW